MEKFISVCVLLGVFAICGTALVGCNISETNHTSSLTSCVNNGGSYVPSGGGNYQCLNKIK